MSHLINKDALVAEINKAIKIIYAGREYVGIPYGEECIVSGLQKVENIIDTLEVKEVEENKLPNPRFPHLNNIVDKVFGTGNLESLEYEEAEQLVLLAKEELLKDLEVKEVDLEKELDKFYGMYRKGGQTFSLEDNQECVDWKVDCNPDFEIAFAKHFFELGLNAQKGE